MANPVSVGGDFLFRCVTDQAFTDLKYSSVRSSRLTATPPGGSDIHFNFSSVTRGDNGSVFSCDDGSGERTVTLQVVCK